MFVIYSKPGCAACNDAKALLTAKNLPFEEQVLDVGQPKLPTVTYYTVEQLKQRVPAARTVPQIFEDGQHLGGLDGLKKHLSK